MAATTDCGVGPTPTTCTVAAGDDLLNGDSGGDALYGGAGSDVLWGGRGHPNSSFQNDRGDQDQYVDFLFGGRGGAASSTVGKWTGGADILDYYPRRQDPAGWHEMTAPYNDGQGVVEEALTQHHQGIDLLYGGWDSDVMQSDVADAGDVVGDRLIDWYDDFNLYTHCDPRATRGAEVKQYSQALLTFVRTLAYGTGLGDSLADVSDTASSAFRELAVVLPTDRSRNSGPRPADPGTFNNKVCD